MVIDIGITVDIHVVIFNSDVNDISIIIAHILAILIANIVVIDISLSLIP